MGVLNKFKYLFIVFLSCSCSNSDDEQLATLNSYIFNRTAEQGGVIACAASDADSGDLLIFYYLESGAKNIKFFQTSSLEDDGADYKNYVEVRPSHSPFFNGYLGKFTQVSANEKWVIITLELDGEINDISKVADLVKESASLIEKCKKMLRSTTDEIDLP